VKVGARLEKQVLRRAEAHWARGAELRRQAGQFQGRGPLSGLRRRLVGRAEEHEETAQVLESLLLIIKSG
jgi:hypothetical protein